MLVIPQPLRSWWRYSQLRPWQLVAPIVIAAASEALAILVYAGWHLLVFTNLAYLLIAISVGAIRAERARRYGCW